MAAVVSSSAVAIPVLRRRAGDSELGGSARRCRCRASGLGAGRSSSLRKLAFERRKETKIKYDIPQSL